MGKTQKSNYLVVMLCHQLPMHLQKGIEIHV